MNPSVLYPEFNISRFRIAMFMSRSVPREYYLGSTWRGILGWELKKLLCPYPSSPQCPDCILHSNCTYYILFEKKTDLPGISDAPRGYIFYAPLSSKADILILEITLLGYCTRFFPAVLQALGRAQDRGPGRSREQFKIVSISENSPSGYRLFNTDKDILSQASGPFPLEEWLSSVQDNTNYRINLSTPLRLRKKGSYLSDLNLSFMFMTLARRLESVSCIFEQAEHLGRERWTELGRHFELLDELPVFSKDQSGKKSGIYKRPTRVHPGPGTHLRCQ